MALGEGAVKRPPEDYWMLFKVIQDRTMPFIAADMRPEMLNSFFGLPAPTVAKKAPEPGPNVKYWIGWMRDFSEIHNSLTRIEHSLVYLSTYPSNRAFRFHGISEADWLRYHLEAYLQETYIFVQRLQAFLGRVEKLTARAGDRSGLMEVRKLQDWVVRSFQNLVTARGGHVHRSRFESDELRNLDLAVLLTKSGKAHQLRPLRAVHYAESLAKWRKQVSANVRQTRNICVALIKPITEILIRNEPPR